MKEKIINTYQDYEFLFADGFDDAIIGICWSNSVPVVVYSVRKCFRILSKKIKTKEGVEEYFNYNVAGSYMGERTPLWCWDV